MNKDCKISALVEQDRTTWNILVLLAMKLPPVFSQYTVLPSYLAVVYMLTPIGTPMSDAGEEISNDAPGGEL